MLGIDDMSTCMGDQLDKAFKDAVLLHPQEARSHFELVDPGVWRVDVSGRLSMLGKEWIGPYPFCIDGSEYDAYGLKSRIIASQQLFLSDIGVSVSASGLPKAWKMFIAVTIFFLLIVAMLAIMVLCHNSDVRSDEDVAKNSVDTILDDLHVRAEKRIVESKPSSLTQPSGNVTVHDSAKYGKSIKELARMAFRASRWDEGIRLVDQLTEAEADAELRYYIGVCYKEGFSVEHDYAEAFFWFKSAAELGNVAAQYELGLVYEKGNGVSRNFNDALRWYRIAAQRGNAMANLSIGLMYDEGKGVARNHTEAAQWYRKASNLGNAHSAYLLGNLYAKGLGVPQSFSIAAELYKKAASAGHAQAGFILGGFYEKGLGVSKSDSEASYWYKKSGELGNSAAMSSWQRLNGSDKMWVHPRK